MQNKRKRILTMLEDGTISTEEALTLLENLSNPQAETNKPEQESEAEHKEENEDKSSKDKESFEQKDSGSAEKEEQSMDDFLEDLRKDFTTVGDRFMQFMQTAAQKVKGFDFETPFGHTVTFTHTLTKPMSEIEEIILDIDNGKVAIHCAESDEARAEFTVKAYNSESEETAKKEFLEKILFVADDDKLRISSGMKLTQVNLDLFVPKKIYTKLTARLMNGSFRIGNMEIDNTHVKTANGKIDVSKLTFKEANFETANGSIMLNGISGKKLSAETLNGRVYIDGSLKEVSAQSLSGNVVVTTTSVDAESINAKTMSGSLEIYIPTSVALSGEISSNMGRLDLQLHDVNRTAEHEQLLQKSIQFEKELENEQSPLRIYGETKTGSVLVCYSASGQ